MKAPPHEENPYFCSSPATKGRGGFFHFFFFHTAVGRGPRLPSPSSFSPAPTTPIFPDFLSFSADSTHIHIPSPESLSAPASRPRTWHLFISGRHPVIGIFGSQNRKPHRGPLFPVEAAIHFPFSAALSTKLSSTSPKAAPQQLPLKKNQPRPHPHQPPTAAAKTCPLHRSLPFPSHGLQLHPTETGRRSFLPQTEHGVSSRCLLPSLLPAP